MRRVCDEAKTLSARGSRPAEAAPRCGASRLTLDALKPFRNYPKHGCDKERIIGGYLVLRGQATVGTVVAMRSLYYVMYGPALNIFGVITASQKALASIDRINEFLRERPQVTERSGALTPARVAGVIAFENVRFSYASKRDVLHEISFVAAGGKTIALVGPSGAGKTTITNLIGRFYDPTDGRITLDGIDLRDLSLKTLRDSISMVFQNMTSPSETTSRLVGRMRPTTRLLPRPARPMRWNSLNCSRKA
jgi:ABC-type transport system involved in Fe-S cluster assembly fused permease/ATPase subunit